MQINPLNTAHAAMQRGPAAASQALAEQFAASEPQGDEQQLRETFDRFVGETVFGQMLSSMRKTQGKPAYFHGGRAEEMFQSQLDQLLVEDVTSAAGDQFGGAMFELFQLQRQAA